MNVKAFFCYYIFTDELKIIRINKKCLIATINPYSFLIAEKDTTFKKALQQSDILLPDGEGIIWAVNFLYGKKIIKIAGYDIFIYLMNELQKSSGKCFFFGSTNDTLLKIKTKANVEFPKVTVDFLSPPFKNDFSEEEDTKFVSIINSAHPDVLFVGMTAPKQEKWVYKNKEKLNVPVIASIGAVFDFYAGNEKRANPLLIKMGLEWLSRSIQNPNRLGRRNLYAIPRFIYYILKQKVKRV